MLTVTPLSRAGSLPQGTCFVLQNAFPWLTVFKARVVHFRQGADIYACSRRPIAQHNHQHPEPVARGLAPAGSRSGPKIGDRIASGKIHPPVYNCFARARIGRRGQASSPKMPARPKICI